MKPDLSLSSATVGQVQRGYAVLEELENAMGTSGGNRAALLETLSARFYQVPWHKHITHITDWTDYRSPFQPFHGLHLPGQICYVPDRSWYDVAHVDDWKLYNLQDLVHDSWLVCVLYRFCTASHDGK